MTTATPCVDLDIRFSSPGATAVPWQEAEKQLKQAAVYWLSTVRPAGWPHVRPLIAVWLDGALYFCIGEDEQAEGVTGKTTTLPPQRPSGCGRNSSVKAMRHAVQAMFS